MPAPTTRPNVQHYASATPQEREAVELVAACVESFENGPGGDAREMFNKRYRQYRGFRRFRDAWVQAGPNDRDGVLYDAKKHWGAHLHIPLSFRTIETAVPRAIAHRPRLLVMPRRPSAEENVANVRMLLDAQQDNIDIDLPFQAVMRSGRIYGIGIGKAFWLKEYALDRRVQRRTFKPGEFVVGKRRRRCVFDDPFFEDVDPFDFMWDPYGHDMRTCGWVVHRLWMGLGQVMERIESRAWNTPSAQALTEAEVRSKGNGVKYDEIWNERMEASGFSSMNHAIRGEQIHEVWEWHDGERVLTVLDRSILVQDAENPCLGKLPFQVYRPTPLQHQMVGIGDLEPLEHLQRELDTLRSQRRDLVTLALAAPVAYDSAAIDEEDLTWSPFAAIEVRNTRPADAIQQLRVHDVPGAGFQEEQVIKQDIDLVSGLSDAPEPPSGTATEAQLVQASLSRRIELGSRRFEIEVVRNVARTFLALNQRMIVADRDPIRQPAEGFDVEQAVKEGRWRWFEIGPAELEGEFEVVPEGGSMAAENVPQMRQDGMQVLQMLGENPHVDPRRPLLFALSKFGVRDPESWLKQAEAPVPQAALEALARMGVDPRLIQRAVEVGQRQDPRLQQQGPDVAQVERLMAGAA